MQMSMEGFYIFKRVNKLEERLDRTEERLSFVENMLLRVLYLPPLQP